MDPDPVPLGYLLNPIIITSIGSILPVLLILIILLIGSALVSAAEVAYFSLSPSDIESLGKDGGKKESAIVALKEQPRQLLATILITNNFINIAIVILSESLLRNIISDATFTRWASSILDAFSIPFFTEASLSKTISFSITVVGVTFLLVLFGEVAPKIYANLNNVRHAKLMATPLTFLNKLTYPLSGFLVGWSSRLEERVYRKRLHSNSNTDKRDLDKAIELTVSDDESRDEVDILKGIIKFGDVTTKQIMKSRVDVVALDTSDTYDQVLQVIKDSGFSRLPVMEEDFDSIQGILYVNDLLGHANEEDGFGWQKYIRNNVLYVPETKKIDDLMKEFQQKRTHMGIVVDEYGGSAGIVTLEDIMEEVVGDIRDEFDSVDEVEYEKLDDHNYIFEGKTLLNDVIRITELDGDIFEEGKGTADSLAGLILELQGMIPKKNREINYKNLKFKIISVDKRRIQKIKITL